MARSLSNLEYVTFLDDIKPDQLGLPDWGGVAQWNGLYVLMFKMPDGEYIIKADGSEQWTGWALSDVSSGIPYGNTVIPILQYIGNVPATQISWTDAFWYSLPANAMQVALENAAVVGQLASQASQYAAQQVADAFSKLIHGASTGLGPALIPLAIVAAAIIFLYVKPSRA